MCAHTYTLEDKSETQMYTDICKHTYNHTNGHMNRQKNISTQTDKRIHIQTTDTHIQTNGRTHKQYAHTVTHKYTIHTENKHTDRHTHQ